MNDPGAYAGYTSFSPSIWLKDRAVLADESELKSKSSLQPRAPALLLSGGEYDAKPPRSVPGYSRSAAKIRGYFRDFAKVPNVERLGRRLPRVENIDVEVVMSPEEGYASVVPAALSRGGAASSLNERLKRSSWYFLYPLSTFTDHKLSDIDSKN